MQFCFAVRTELVPIRLIAQANGSVDLALGVAVDERHSLGRRT